MLSALALLVLFVLSWSQPAKADEWVVVRPRSEQQPSLFEPDTAIRTFGVSLIAGVPSGIAPSLSIHPATNFVHIDIGPSGALAFGVRGGVTIDPFDWVVAPTLTVEGSYFGWADLPGIRGGRFDVASVGVLAGVEVGRRSRFRIFARAGYAHLWGSTKGLTARYAVALDAPHYTLDLLPALELGLTAFL